MGDGESTFYMQQFDPVKFGTFLGRTDQTLADLRRELDTFRSDLKEAARSQGERIGALETRINTMELNNPNGWRKVAKPAGVGAGGATVIWWILELLKNTWGM